ncbi:porin [Castellaniella sp.]|uniref:porin n=1 Tax=Castellaniella sp. TaxID=1955812 RepID=UPI003563873C
MKKTLLAAALLAGFATAGVAQAETSVTLYGVVDSGYGYQNFKYNGPDGAGEMRQTKSGVRGDVNAGNRWGLRGSEDLGDGLRAIFTLEQGFNLGSGEFHSDRQWHRQSFLGLSSDDWGTFTIGRQYSAGSAFGVYRGPNGMSMGDNETVFGGVGVASADRVDNSFRYATPNLSGFNAILMYGTGTGTGGDTVGRYKGVGGDWEDYANRGNRVSVGLGYNNGPIGIGLSYDRQSNGDRDAITNWVISGAYDFEVIKLMLAFGQDRHGKLGWDPKVPAIFNLTIAPDLPNVNSVLEPGDHSFKANNYAVGLSAPVGGGSLYAGWSHSNSNLDDSDAWGRYAGNINTYQINYRYPLSKRTTVYAYGSYGTNLGYVRDLKGTEAGLGLTHAF